MCLYTTCTCIIKKEEVFPRLGKCVHNKALFLRFVLSVSLSLFRERERERRADQAQQLWLLFFFISFALLFSESERDIMKSSSSSSSSSIEATDCFSPLSEHQKQRTPSELRFRFRSTALKQSPSSDALTMIRNDEEEDFLEEDQLARYVEPPELPTLAMHKVLGKRFITHMRNV